MGLFVVTEKGETEDILIYEVKNLIAFQYSELAKEMSPIENISCASQQHTFVAHLFLFQVGLPNYLAESMPMG